MKNVEENKIKKELGSIGEINERRQVLTKL